jgi:hypothetical protein
MGVKADALLLVSVCKAQFSVISKGGEQNEINENVWQWF